MDRTFVLFAIYVEDLTNTGSSMRAWLAVLVGVACTCVISVWGDANKNIYAPFNYLDKKEQWLYKVTMGPSAWICSPYIGEDTWEAYELIDDYINSKNGKNMTLRRTTWPNVHSVPITEAAKKDEKKSSVCHYIERELHCDVPMPQETRLYAVNKIPRAKFYMKEFFGQANDKRVAHYVQKMLQKMAELQITNVDLSFYFLAYFDENMKGIMFTMTD